MSTLTNVAKYEAIMRAADHIERNPDSYNFLKTRTPGGPETIWGGCTACMWGWMGHFAGIEADTTNCVTARSFGASTYELYATATGSMDDPRVAAEMLRAFAKQFSVPESTPTPALEPAFIAFRKLLQNDAVQA